MIPTFFNGNPPRRALGRKGIMGIRGEVFSSKTSVGKRTYFFNVKENRHGDLFLNIVESKKHEGTGFERHSVIVFGEDLEDFVGEFQKAVEFMQQRPQGPGRDKD